MSFSLMGVKRGLVVNECPVGIQSQAGTESAGEKLREAVMRREPALIAIPHLNSGATIP